MVQGTHIACRLHKHTFLSTQVHALTMNLTANHPLWCLGHHVHQTISPSGCGPLVKPSKEALQNTISDMPWQSQMLPEPTELNSAQTPVSPPTQKNISNPQKIRNTQRHAQTLRTSQCC